MNSMKLTSAAALVVVLALSGRAAAQDQQPVSNITGSAPVGESRIEVGLAFAQTLASSTFSSSLKVREYQEDGTFDASYKVGKAPGAGFDLQYNLKPKFGVRLGMQTFSRKSDGTFTAQIPHPFFFSTPRKISGAESGLGFSEAAVSLTGVFRGGSGKWRLSVEGGPAFFSVSATVADKISYGEVYPYDTATYSGVTSSKKKVSPVGIALGLEVGRQLSNAVTVVAQGRFSQGSGDLDVNGTKVNVKAGGAQARLGLRIVLARKKAVS
jgi:opacity protein-like surface antigen